MKIYTRQFKRVRLHSDLEQFTSFHLETPEGVVLAFEVPPVGSRIVAFFIDLFYLFIAIISLVLISISTTLLISDQTTNQIVLTFLMLSLFVCRMGYFIYFEIKTQGTTPGKAKLRLRVIDRRGQPLSSYAVILRNLLREIEFFLPIMCITSIDVRLSIGGIEWAMLLIWTLVLLTFPLFNRNRLRLGDLVGGTIVVKAPKVILRQDLSESVSSSDQTNTFTPQFKFTHQQLDIYGIYELQKLEDILRDVHKYNAETISLVVTRISDKIDWQSPEKIHLMEDKISFLRAFYAAQRAHLEQKMQLGDRREFKRSSFSLKKISKKLKGNRGKNP